MKRIVLLLVVLLVLVPFFVVFFLGGSLVRAGVEKGTAWALDVPVTVEGGSLQPLAGTVGLRKMAIGNPPGFQSKSSFALESMKLDVGMTSLLSDPVVVDEIALEAPHITLEVDAKGGTNLGSLMDRARARSGGGKPKDGGAASKGMKVGVVTIRGGTLEIAGAFGGGAPLRVPLPDLTLRDLGTGPNKNETTLPELLDRILAAVAKAGSESNAIPQAIAQQLHAEAARQLAELDKAVKGVQDAAKKTVDDAGKELKKGSDALQKASEDAAKQVDGILKPKKKQ